MNRQVVFRGPGWLKVKWRKMIHKCSNPNKPRGTFCTGEHHLHLFKLLSLCCRQNHQITGRNLCISEWGRTFLNHYCARDMKNDTNHHFKESWRYCFHAALVWVCVLTRWLLNRLWLLQEMLLGFYRLGQHSGQELKHKNTDKYAHTHTHGQTHAHTHARSENIYSSIIIQIPEVSCDSAQRTKCTYYRLYLRLWLLNLFLLHFLQFTNAAEINTS